ncbi:MAG: glycosyltransferase family 2 protein [Candidatus Desulfofervidus auxilii]|nr:glycosyltransferase family 2 protein [Candidatus Desulfofervidus auxilii]
MKQKKVAIVLINYKNYAKRFLPDCIKSLHDQTFPAEAFKIFIVDNESTPESVKYLKKIAPEAELILNKKNEGFAKANNQAFNKAMKEDFEYLVTLNIDTIVHERWLEELVKAAEKHLEAGAIQSLIMLYPEMEKVNSLGNELHFLGLAFCQGYGQKLPKSLPKLKEITCFSGAAVLTPAKVLKEVGMFDETFFMYHEDTDLSWRMRMAGYKIFLASRSIVYHKYEFSRSMQQFYYLERNRIMMMLENYKLPTLFLIMPVFLFMEIGVLFYSLINHALIEKLKAYMYFFNIQHLKTIMESRKEKQLKRKLKEKDVIKTFTSSLEFYQIKGGFFKFLVKYMVNSVFRFYWLIIKNIIWW